MRSLCNIPCTNFSALETIRDNILCSFPFSPLFCYHLQMPCVELTKSGVHFTRVCGIIFTFFLVGYSVFTYCYYFLASKLGNGEVLGYISLVLFLPNCLLLLISLWRTVFSHPGRVNPNSFGIDTIDRRVNERKRREAEEFQRRRAELQQQSTGQPPEDPSLPPLHTYTPNLCTKCYVYKINRIHHCSTCGECILRMDHHCPWIGQCVGRDNHKFFILFLLYTCTTGIVISTTSATSISFFEISSNNPGARNNFGPAIAQFFGWMFAAIFALILIPFLIATISNATEGTTTLEKKIAERKRRQRAQQLMSGANGHRRSANNSPSEPTTQPTTVEVQPRPDADEILSSMSNSSTPLTHAVAIASRLPDHHSDSDDDDESCCCNCAKTLNLLEEIFGNSEEAKRSSRLWWLLPFAPTFKTDEADLAIFFEN